jgi:hypothetical protein
VARNDSSSIRKSHAQSANKRLIIERAKPTSKKKLLVPRSSFFPPVCKLPVIPNKNKFHLAQLHFSGKSTLALPSPSPSHMSMMMWSGLVKAFTAAAAVVAVLGVPSTIASGGFSSLLGHRRRQRI